MRQFKLGPAISQVQSLASCCFPRIHSVILPTNSNLRAYEFGYFLDQTIAMPFAVATHDHEIIFGDIGIAQTSTQANL